ncbi:hypothetical protein [Thermococcus thioreducens]|uniref:hypothetical protein n=1 Tax=Thermococcus thioreducens TaxID=277988 RepID=UPI00117DBE32|nr:hypothetical protein [Thermococcus thioreducens]
MGWLFGKKTTEGIIKSIAKNSPNFKEWQRLEKRKLQLLDKRAELIEGINRIDAEIRMIESYQSMLMRQDTL